METTVVIGGGVIGLLSAYELRRRGRSVVVLDKGEFGRGASKGNAGWITPSLSAPVPAPGLVSESIRWMLRPDSPLYISPRAVPGMLGWLMSFWRHCNERAYRRGMAALAQFNRTTLADFDALRQAGLEFEMHTTGLLYVFLSEQTMERWLRDAEGWMEAGASKPVSMTPSETVDFEPSLRPDVAGSAFVPSERHVRPESLLCSVQEWLSANGVELRAHCPAVDFVIESGRIVAVRTAHEVIPAEQVLLATGAEAAYLARRAGFRLPMQAGKGYSLTIQEPRLKPKRSMYLVEGRVALTPFRDGLRVAGTMELSGVNTNLDERRIAGIKKSADRYLRDWQGGGDTEAWVGMRPMLPDGLPAIGRAPGIDNLFVATGHAMLGITLGPTTARAIADLMTQGDSEYDLTPFDPGRFH